VVLKRGQRWRYAERREEPRTPADVSAGGLEDLGDLRDDVSSGGVDVQQALIPTFG
jgi:hypothetical protein